jgi:hypothetical protein
MGVESNLDMQRKEKEAVFFLGVFLCRVEIKNTPFWRNN